MWNTITTTVAAYVLTLLLLYAHSTISQTPCQSNAPDSCNFTCEDTCGWTNETGWIGNKTSMDSGTSSGWALLFGAREGTGTLSGRNACSTGGNEHCFTFWYRFSKNFIIDLKVVLDEDGKDEVELWKQQFSSPEGKWSRVKLAISTSSDFVLRFKSQLFRHDFKADELSVDEFEYFQTPCDSVASEATLEASSSDILPCPSQSTTTSQPTDNTQEGQTSVDTSTQFPTGNSADNTSRGNSQRNTVSVTPSSGDNSTESAENSGDGGGGSNAGLIVGVIFAVLFILVIAIGAVIFVFRKQLKS